MYPIGTRSISNLFHKTEKERSKFSFKVHCALENTRKNRIRGKFTCLIQVLDRFRSRMKSSKYFPSSLFRQTFRKDLRVAFVLSKIADTKLSRNIFFFAVNGDHGVVIFFHGTFALFRFTAYYAELNIVVAILKSQDKSC